MPVPRLIATFLTDGFYADHVGTLNMPLHCMTLPSSPEIGGDEGSGRFDPWNISLSTATSTTNMNATTVSNNTTSSSATVVVDHTTPKNRQHSSPLSSCSSTNPLAAFAILRSLKDLSSEAQVAVHMLPCNAIYFMNSLTKEMSVNAIRNTVPKRYLPLYSSAATTAPLDSYIYQLLTFLRSEEEEIMIAFVLLAKISMRIPICTLSVTRMFLTAMVVASKIRSDERISMQAYATFGGVEVGDMLAMERAFLTALDFDVGVKPEEYADMVYSLRHYCVVAASEGVEWITEVWSAMAPRIAVPDLRHLTATPPKVLYPHSAKSTSASFPSLGIQRKRPSTSSAPHVMPLAEEMRFTAPSALSVQATEARLGEMEIATESQVSHGQSMQGSLHEHWGGNNSSYNPNGGRNNSSGNAVANASGSGGVRMTFHH